ncbi:extensin family protein [Pseudochrobactrum sp. XF203]|uniref:extensin-like domain-containing protein n=1 Tax=Pseudochrobactrum sp. XF203 TaxID=2879116 RepID=UPI001CE312BA|nr:extensin family protein [Pseudochrobactrum sp. XF203]UCA44910.1 extensin family protein [Pseudochrobactrum sp. XF203]
MTIPATAKTVPIPAQKPAAEESKTIAPAPKPDISKPETPKTERIYQAACLPLVQNEVTGKVIPPVNEGQCQIRSPLEITAFTKPVPIELDQTITTNCTMTVALTEWVQQANNLAKTHLGSDIKTIGTGSHYQCRKVNNGSAGRVSEHAFGNALDIMSFTLANGEKTTLATDWNGSEKQKKFWRELHKASCTLFMTVLGPEADSTHETNLHLDMGCHGKSCTYRICQ